MGVSDTDKIDGNDGDSGFGFLDDWDELPEEWKDGIIKDMEKWIDCYGNEVRKADDHEGAVKLADQMLGIFGRAILPNGRRMNGDLYSELIKRGIS